MLFPFFCFLIGYNKRSWGVTVVALVFNWLCDSYFNVGKVDIIYDAIGGGGLVNPVTKFLGGICFEIYLYHIVILRLLEKLHLVHLFGNSLLAYIITSLAVNCGSVVFSACAE